MRSLARSGSFRSSCVGISAARPSIARHISASAHPAAQYFATCHPGLEEVVAQELRSPAIRAENVQVGKAGVFFSGPQPVLYRSNLWLRAAIRVLQLLREIDLDPSQPAGESVYDAFRAAADWPALVRDKQSFSVDARVWGNSNLTNSQLLSVRARDAICDAVRDKR
jgi:23S rRNA G2445 N2-methylase RlmL